MTVRHANSNWNTLSAPPPFPLINDPVDLPKLREERRQEWGKECKEEAHIGFHVERERERERENARVCLQQLFSGYQAVAV
jgi:hypothetical protein